MGFNLSGLGAAFQGQQEYDEYLQAKKIRDMQIAQLQAQNDPKSLEMAWNAMNSGRQPVSPQVPPMPGEASMPAEAPQMPQGAPQTGPMAQPQGQGAPVPPAPPIQPYKPLNAQGGGQDMQMPDQGGYAPTNAMPKPDIAPPVKPGQQNIAPNAQTSAPVELKHNMTLQDARQFIQQNYGSATAAQKFQALEKVHGYLSQDAKIEFQEKQLAQKVVYENALVDIKKQIATTDESYKKTKGELNEAQAEVSKMKKLADGLAIKLNLAERKVVSGERMAGAAETSAGARVITANASASRAATAAANAGSGGEPKKGWKMYGSNGDSFRVNENAGKVEKKINGEWEEVDRLPDGAVHVGANISHKDATRDKLVLGAAANVTRMLNNIKDKGKLRASPFVGAHPDGVVSNITHGVGRMTLSDKQKDTDTDITGIVDEGIPVFTGGLRSSDSFRNFIISQLPRTIGDDAQTAAHKWKVFQDNITGQSNAFRNKFNSDPKYKAPNEKGNPSDAKADTNAIEETKMIGGVKYHKVNGDWMQE